MPNLSPRKAAILATSERLAGSREQFRKRATFFHEEDLRYLRFLIPEGLRVLEIGCGTGAVLAGLKPSFGVGIDISPAMVEQAKCLHRDLHFQVGDVVRCRLRRLSSGAL
jgi:ubiquinone/menaquinone biosynthesis C-methylase UbiE